MRRRVKPAKAKVEGKRSPARKSPKADDARVRDLEERLAEAVRRETEALEQQTATSEILRVISSSPTDVQPVFDTIVQSASQLCDGLWAITLRYDGAQLHLAAQHNPRPGKTDAVARFFPRPVVRDSINGRAILDKIVVHIPDATAETGVAPEILRAGVRAVLVVPMLREGEAIGTVAVSRGTTGPFSRRQVELLKTFADQAVIAIENVRLFNQTKEALEQQTATSEILQVISSSPTDLQPVFETIVRSAATLCRAFGAAIFLSDGQTLHEPASYGASSEARAATRARYPRPLDGETAGGLAILTRSVIRIPDTEAPSVTEHVRQVGKLIGFRSLLSVPMLRQGEAVGAINVTRVEPGAFRDAEVDLLKTFADQAVIAIENVRLFTELQEKNRALTEAHGRVTEALEQQTATSEILRAIAHAKTDVQPVFDAIVRSAAELCHATISGVFLTDGRTVYHPANYGGSPEARSATRARFPRPLDMETTPGMAILTRSVVHLPDTEDPSVPEHIRQVGRALGFRSTLAVPMLREGEAVGAVTAHRWEPGQFSDSEGELLKTFADQALIAVQNVRLFTELEARTAALSRSVEQLTALGELGRAVSSTLDLGTVLTTIVARAVQLSGLDGGVVFEYDEAAEEFVHRVATETGEALAKARRTTRIRKGEGVLGRTAITLEPIQVPDITLPGAYEGRLRETLVESGIRAILAVPMIYEGRLIGCLGVTRNRPGNFLAETIELLRTFATQSALAIQNARLFEEIADKSRQLEAASQHKSEFLANMSHELRTPLNAILGFSEVLAQGMFGAVNEKQAEYLHDILESGRHLLSLINDILDLSKIEAGRMELEVSEFDLPQAIQNALTLVRERALRRGIALQYNIDDRIGAIRADERKVKQVLLNLLSNAIKFTPDGGKIEVRAAPADGMIEVSVADTGIGVAPEDLETVFEEFRQVGTADKKAEGTGLGLALARKFIELHGGRIWVESEPRRGSTFTFTLPVAPEASST